jgi:hypothetical protein
LTRPDATAATPGVVTGRLLTWLRIEGLAVAGAGLALFAGTGQSWWLISALFLFAMGGYLAGTSPGAHALASLHAGHRPLASRPVSGRSAQSHQARPS